VLVRSIFKNSPAGAFPQPMAKVWGGLKTRLRHNHLSEAGFGKIKKEVATWVGRRNTSAVVEAQLIVQRLLNRDTVKAGGCARHFVGHGHDVIDSTDES
jgi:hypothetical protein